MDNSTRLSPGFIPVEKAIELIKADTRDNAVVDLQFLVNNIPFSKVGRSYNIRLLKTVDGKVIRDGTVYVMLATEYDRQILLKAITDAYNARTGILVNPAATGVNKITTMIDEEKQQSIAAPRVNTESEIKEGDYFTGQSEQVVKQGV